MIDTAQPENDSSLNESELYKSRTQIKREMSALQKLGKRLVSLPEKHILKIELPELLKEALLAAKTITSNEAKRRQFQYIGRLMREVDHEEIEAFLDYRDHGKASDQMMASHLEKWVDSLQPGDNKAAETIIEEKPHLDRQKLKQLMRNYLKAKETNRKKARKTLVKFLNQ